ncbi:MAG: FAD-binding domain-containing protein [Pseudomonadota bacterium]
MTASAHKQRSNLPEVQVVWFKRDLRTADHRPLVNAAARGDVLPLLVVEPELWRQPDMSARQFDFFRACADGLFHDLAQLGQPLIVRTGAMPDVLEDLQHHVRIVGLWSHEETGNQWTYRRDLRVKAWCRQQGIDWHETPQTGVVRRIASRNGWARRWDTIMAEPIAQPPAHVPPLKTDIAESLLPTARDLGFVPESRGGFQPGGRRPALATLESFLNKRGSVYRTAMSSPVTATGGCSRLSPYLAWGAVSMREVAHATRARQRQLRNEQPISDDAANKRWRSSLHSFQGRLHWHCHFMQKLEDEPRLEFENLHRAYDGLRRPQHADSMRLNAWRNGETGLPFVDACMRFLAATGWLNFRARAMLVAFSSYHLWLDWREPGLHLARQFTDYEPGIHWPQIQMQSGTTGTNAARIYNPVKQGHDQDPTGDFVRKWVPELAQIAGADVHEPWKHEAAGSILDKTYPMPVVDYQEAARMARQKIYGVRKGSDFRRDAAAIVQKHGSRKSGIPMRGVRPASPTKGRRGKSGSDDQMSLDLDTAPRSSKRTA